jgi:hypothetical protein
VHHGALAEMGFRAWPLADLHESDANRTHAVHISGKVLCLATIAENLPGGLGVRLQQYACCSNEL